MPCRLTSDQPASRDKPTLTEVECSDERSAAWRSVQGRNAGADKLRWQATVERFQDLSKVICFSFLVYHDVHAASLFEIVKLLCYNFIPISQAPSVTSLSRLRVVTELPVFGDVRFGKRGGRGQRDSARLSQICSSLILYFLLCLLPHRVSVTCQMQKLEQPIHSRPDKYPGSPVHQERLVKMRLQVSLPTHKTRCFIGTQLLCVAGKPPYSCPSLRRVVGENAVSQLQNRLLMSTSRTMSGVTTPLCAVTLALRGHASVQISEALRFTGRGLSRTPEWLNSKWLLTSYLPSMYIFFFLLSLIPGSRPGEKHCCSILRFRRGDRRNTNTRVHAVERGFTVSVSVSHPLHVVGQFMPWCRVVFLVTSSA